TDDTVAIRSAIAAASGGGGVVYFPPGTYLISGAGVACGTRNALLCVTKALIVQGAGMKGSQITPAGSVGPTVDVLSYFPDAGQIEGFTVRDLGIVPASGTPARYGIVLDANTRAFDRARIERCYIGPFGDAAVVLDNTAANANAMFLTTIEDDLLYKGVKPINATDSIRVTGNQMTGDGYALQGNMQTGATNLEFIFNNVTSKQMVKLDGGQNPLFIGNVFEGDVVNFGTTASNNALLDLNGLTTQIKGAVVAYNDFRNVSGGAFDGLRINNADGTKVQGNNFNQPGASGVKIVASNAKNSVIYPNYLVAGGGTLYSDSNPITPSNATGTFYVLRSNSGLGFDTPSFIRST